MTHFSKVILNFTTNELVNHKRYYYISVAREGYQNPFDLGIESNVREFLRGYIGEEKRWNYGIVSPTSS